MLIAMQYSNITNSIQNANKRYNGKIVKQF